MSLSFIALQTETGAITLTIPAEELQEACISSQARISNAGRALGGNAFTKGALYHILKNRIYIGEVSHKGQSFVGEQQGLIDRDMFDQVQQMLIQNAVARKAGMHVESPALLARLVWDGLGRRMSPNHARKGKARYRYYASRRDHRADRTDPAWRVPAADLEEIVVGAITHHLRDREALSSAVTQANLDTNALQRMFDKAASCASELAGCDPHRRRAMLAQLADRVTVH